MLLLAEVAPSLEMGILTELVAGVGRNGCTAEMRTTMTIQRRRVAEAAGAAATGIIMMLYCRQFFWLGNLNYYPQSYKNTNIREKMLVFVLSMTVCADVSDEWE